MIAYIAVVGKSVWEIQYLGFPFLTPRRIYKDGVLVEQCGTADECKARVSLLTDTKDIQYDQYEDS